MTARYSRAAVDLRSEKTEAMVRLSCATIDRRRPDVTDFG
ncbi:hypothetical protein SAMN04487968_11129 [Nocardioides terrae]|uniref:Uncharacterized protein n=1 Tax=Nocardioides terrae TaxID=574651 RepID=A0A1I1LV82_9ACTN|nr:hypothetical protein SAMN04487968_11129 [Nocardioides terrae]